MVIRVDQVFSKAFMRDVENHFFMLDFASFLAMLMSQLMTLPVAVESPEGN